MEIKAKIPCQYFSSIFRFFGTWLNTTASQNSTTCVWPVKYGTAFVCNKIQLLCVSSMEKHSFYGIFPQCNLSSPSPFLLLVKTGTAPFPWHTWHFADYLTPQHYLTHTAAATSSSSSKTSPMKEQSSHKYSLLRVQYTFFLQFSISAEAETGTILTKPHPTVFIAVNATN